MALLELQKGEIPVKRKPYSFEKANRPLSDEEKEAAKNAIRFSIRKFPQTNPVQGTLAYTFRNLSGGNEAVVEYLKNVIPIGSGANGRTGFIKNILILWRNMDENSRKRVDIWDVLCDHYNINKAKFFGVVQEGIFNHEKAMQQISLTGYTDEFVDLVKRMAGKERNTQDRALLAKMLKIAEDSPLVAIQDNSVNTKNELHVHAEKAVVPSFISSIKKGDEGVRREVSVERLLPKQEVKVLTEGEQNYIEAEIVSETREKVLIEQQSEEDFEYDLMKSAKDI